jgi:hypothetical protein
LSKVWLRLLRTHRGCEYRFNRCRLKLIWQPVEVALSRGARCAVANLDWRIGMANSLRIKVNGLTHGVSASLDTPLLYILHNKLHLHGPRFGCGLAQCGACSVLLDGKEFGLV